MKLFLQIEISNWQNSSYYKPLLTFASSLSSDLIGAEMDNQSDSSIADILIKLSSQATLVLVLIKANENLPLGATLKLIHHLFRIDPQIYSVVLSGNDEQVKKLLSGFGEKLIEETDEEKIKNKISEFASA